MIDDFDCEKVLRSDAKQHTAAAGFDSIIYDHVRAINTAVI